MSDHGSQTVFSQAGELLIVNTSFELGFHDRVLSSTHVAMVKL